TTSEEPVPVQTTTTSEEPVPVQTTTTSEEPVPVQTTTTSEEPQPIETTTTSDVVKPAHEYEVTWEIGKDIGYAGESVELPIIVKGDVDEAMVYNSYLFTLEIADGPILKPESIRSGSAYSEMAIEANGLQIAGTNSTGDSEGYNGATILYLTFDLPADLAAGKYDVKFAGDVEAHNRALDIFNITEENGYIQVIPKDVTLEQKEFQFDVEGLSKFYFSHDHREFIKDGLLQSELISLGSLMARPVLSDPTIETEWAPADLDKIEFNLKDETLTSPKAVFDTKVAPTLDDTFGKAFFKGQVAFTISTSFDTYNPETGEIETVEQKDTDTLYDGSPMVTGNIYIGVKGDTNLNGTANAQDAGSQLVYAAEFGSGMNPNILTVESDMITAIQAEGEEAAKELENFVYFLSDVTDESEDHGDTSSILDGTATIDAKDASKVLIYAAQFGSGMNPDWYRVLDEPLPKYTKLIGAADGNNDKS
ncbi:MAG: hypothetical protein K2H89_09445, partial [Oscillospiraceae bacterium]|nr:hypothetical protein [Oscillospiraceae bacterium]